MRHEHGTAVHISGFSGAIVGTEMLQVSDASLNARDDDDIFATSGIWDGGTASGLLLSADGGYAEMHEMGKLKFGLNSFFIEFYVKVNGWTGSPVLVKQSWFIDLCKHERIQYFVEPHLRCVEGEPR
jgi:hypothetical protein